MFLMVVEIILTIMKRFGSRGTLDTTAWVLLQFSSMNNIRSTKRSYLIVELQKMLQIYYVMANFMTSPKQDVRTQMLRNRKILSLATMLSCTVLLRF